MLNLKHSIAGQETTRYIAATGTEFPGRKLLLGQLVYYRTDAKLRDKFEPSASLALFCGYRLDSGPESFKGVYLLLDYKKVKAGSLGADLATSVPFEELFVPEGEEVFPMRAAFERAIEGFAEPKFPDTKGLEVPFSPLSPDSTPAKRREYITSDRLIKYGGTQVVRHVKGNPSRTLLFAKYGLTASSVLIRRQSPAVSPYRLRLLAYLLHLHRLQHLQLQVLQLSQRPPREMLTVIT